MTRLGDIARVEEAPAEDRRLFRGNGLDQIGLAVTRQAQANDLEISEGVTALAGIAFAGSALAADLPRRAAPPPVFTPVPVFTWTGFYAGFNAGYGFDVGQNSNTYALPTGTVLGSPGTNALLTVTNSRANEGFVGGGQIGYNYQFTPGSGVVVGVEAELYPSMYNRINGTHASQNHWLLTDVLRDEWGFEGVVVSEIAEGSTAQQKAMEHFSQVLTDNSDIVLDYTGSGSGDGLPSTWPGEATPVRRKSITSLSTASLPVRKVPWSPPPTVTRAPPSASTTRCAPAMGVTASSSECSTSGFSSSASPFGLMVRATGAQPTQSSPAASTAARVVSRLPPVNLSTLADMTPSWSAGAAVSLQVTIEFISTFIIRPVTLTLRLLMNMMVGHLLLVLFFSATQFFLFTMGGWWSALAAGSLAFGFVFTLFEILVAVLQAYVFALLTAVYIQLAVAEEH